MKQSTLNSFLIAMKTELKEAEGKHPKFCDELCDSEEALTLPFNLFIFWEKEKR